ncbi:MAG: DUF2306 domain-containing protein [Pseudomonadota bacterium]
MSLEPLLAEPSPVPSHAFAAMAALALGIIQFARPKGGGLHRVLGWTWVSLMAYVAASGLFIYNLRLIGPFSPIHILCLITLASLTTGVLAARRGRIGEHRATMRSLFALALVVTGFFTFIPGRAMWDVITGG